jgi:hypothetical protein
MDKVVLIDLRVSWKCVGRKFSFCGQKEPIKIGEFKGRSDIVFCTVGGAFGAR